MPEDNKDAIKRVIDKSLLQKELPSGVHNFFNDVIQRCAVEHVEFDGAIALEYWWDLARLGVVAVPGGELATLSGPGLPRLILTERGRRMLERGEASPHDPAKYLNAVRKRIANPDAIAMTYLDEAVGAWRAGLNRSSAVMLGCACEQLVLLLAEGIAAADVPPWSNKVSKELAATPSSISRVFNLARECLASLACDKRLPGTVADALDRKLSAVFDHARVLRNQSGHPMGADVSAEDAEAGLLLFPGFYVLADGLCEHLAALKPSAK